MAEPLPCPMCGHAAGEVREVVADRVWSLECSSQRANHTASVMSWTSAEHCVETWNRYASPPVAVQEEGDAFLSNEQIDRAAKVLAECMNEQLYLIRTVGDHFYFKGSGMFAVPKVYKTGDAKRVVRKENKFREGINNNPAYKYKVPCALVEAVEVTFVLGETTQFKDT